MTTVTFMDKYQKEKTYVGDIYFEEIKVNNHVSVINCFFKDLSTHQRIAYFSIPPKQFPMFLANNFSCFPAHSFFKQDPYNAIGPFVHEKQEKIITIKDGKSIL